MAVRTYDPNAITLSFFGYPISGFQEGTFVSVERSSETYARVVGVGDTSRTRSHDKGGRITFTLMQTAPINDWLAALLSGDEAENNVVGPAIVRDNSGNSTYTSTESWLVTQPTGEFSTDQTGREYMIECADLAMFTGSSADPAINEQVQQAIAAAGILNL